MQKESNIQNAIRLAIAKYGSYFRVNVGTGWRGRAYQRQGSRLTITDPVPLTTGVPKGFPDLFGFTMIEVTPDMVGTRIPVFTGIEVKTARGRASSEQMNFIEHLQQHNAIAGICRSDEQARELITNAFKQG